MEGEKFTPEGIEDWKAPETTATLKGDLIRKKTESEAATDIPESKLRMSSNLTEALGKSAEHKEYDLQIGDVIDVKDLNITSSLGRDVYSGKAEIKNVAEKGSVSGLRIKGKPINVLPDTTYTFAYRETDLTSGRPVEYTFTAYKTAVEENLRRLG